MGYEAEGEGKKGVRPRRPMRPILVRADSTVWQKRRLRDLQRQSEAIVSPAAEAGRSPQTTSQAVFDAELTPGSPWPCPSAASRVPSPSAKPANTSAYNCTAVLLTTGRLSLTIDLPSPSNRPTFIPLPSRPSLKATIISAAPSPLILSSPAIPIHDTSKPSSSSKPSMSRPIPLIRRPSRLVMLMEQTRLATPPPMPPSLIGSPALSALGINDDIPQRKPTQTHPLQLWHASGHRPSHLMAEAPRDSRPRGFVALPPTPHQERWKGQPNTHNPYFSAISS